MIDICFHILIAKHDIFIILGTKSYFDFCSIFAIDAAYCNQWFDIYEIANKTMED